MLFQDAKQQYVNGHFFYADKFPVLTNGLDVIRDITFLGDDFKEKHFVFNVYYCLCILKKQILNRSYKIKV